MTPTKTWLRMTGKTKMTTMPTSTVRRVSDQKGSLRRRMFEGFWRTFFIAQPLSQCCCNASREHDIQSTGP